MRRRSSLAIMLVTVAILMSFSVVVATNTNVSSSIQAPESRDASHLNESEGEIYTVTVDGTNLRFSPDAVTLNGRRHNSILLGKPIAPSQRSRTWRSF